MDRREANFSLLENFIGGGNDVPECDVVDATHPAAEVPSG
jgi:hypothetical protein